jgi:membrane protease YdiL (CAAX protease family)
MVYGPMGAIGASWAYWSRKAVFRAPAVPWAVPRGPWLLGVWCLIAILLAIIVIITTRWLVVRTRWARRLHMTLRGPLLGLTPSRIALLSVLSASAEELFFRAALTPSTGLWGSALIFGLCHVTPKAGGISWSLWALVMGVAFGALFLASGSLLPPLLAHALINHENMHYICNYDPTPLDIDRLTPQGPRRGSV